LIAVKQKKPSVKINNEKENIMSKKYVCELLRNVPLDDMDMIRDYYIDSDYHLDINYFDGDFSEKPLSDFIDFLETRIDDNADNNEEIIRLMTSAVSSLKALERIQQALSELYKSTGFLPDFGDLFSDEIVTPAYDKIFAVVNLNDL
jgi:hypothetical protein